jgi:hypothetical protein
MSDFTFNFISSPASASSPTGWVYEESHTADFGDKRLNERFEWFLGSLINFKQNGTSNNYFYPRITTKKN